MVIEELAQKLDRHCGGFERSYLRVSHRQVQMPFVVQYSMSRVIDQDLILPAGCFEDSIDGAGHVAVRLIDEDLSLGEQAEIRRSQHGGQSLSIVLWAPQGLQRRLLRELAA